MKTLPKNSFVDHDQEIKSIISYIKNKWNFEDSDIFTIVQESYDLGRKSAGNLFSSYAFTEFSQSIQIPKTAIPHPNKKYFDMCIFDFDGPFLFCDAITGSSEDVRAIFSNQSLQSLDWSLKNLYSTISPLFLTLPKPMTFELGLSPQDMTDEELTSQEISNSNEFNGVDSSTMCDFGFQEKSHPCIILNSKNNAPIVNLLLKSIFEHGHFCQIQNNTAELLHELESIKAEEFKYNSIEFFKIQPIQDLLSVTSNRTLNTIIYHDSLKNPKHPNPFTENCNVDDVTNKQINILQNTNYDPMVIDDIITSILEENKNPDFQAAELKKKIEITTKTIAFFNHESFITQKTSYNKKM